MTLPLPPRHIGFTLTANFLGSTRFAAALTHVIIGAEFASLLLRELIGWAGLIGIVTALVVLASLSLVARRAVIEWHGLLPISLLVFVGWALLSVIWSHYQWATLGSIAYFAAVTMLGVYVALNRDTIQIARAFGDVLRVILALSIALEIISGLLIDTPLHFLGIAGALDRLGPIQGIFGARNTLGVVTLIAIVTFGTELRTRSIDRRIAAASLILAGITLMLARSPIAWGSAIVVGVSALALFGIRRVRPERKRFWQIGLLVAAVAVIVVVWIQRQTIISALAASGELSLRLRLWAQLRALIPVHQLEGWGWAGIWRNDVDPYQTLLLFTDRNPASGLNAYLDVWFQLGLIGLLAFIGLAGLTFIRSWLLASRQRSIVYAWPALVLIVLLTTGLAESSVLVEFGWLTFVVCSVKAARELSWRTAFADLQPVAPRGINA